MLKKMSSALPERRTGRVILSVLLFGFFWAIAAGQARSGETADSLSYRLKWLFNVSVVGDLDCVGEGFFSGNGLQVTVKAGGPERDAIKEIELGHARFGVASADQVIRARAKGSPVVVVAQLFQVNPLQWIYRPDRTAVDKLADLKGKTLGVTFGGNDETILRTLLAKGGIREDEVRLFSVRYDYTPFYRQRVDIWPVYRNAQGVILQDKLARSGEPTAFFNPAQYGVKFVANSVVTAERFAEENPDTVRRFVAALIKAWTLALEESRSEKALDILQRFDRDTARPLLAAQLAATRQMVRPAPGFAVGTIDVSGWQQTEEIMLAQGQIDAPVGVVKFLVPNFLPPVR